MNSETTSVQMKTQKPAVSLTICGSFDRLTQPEMSFSVSRFTVLILRIKGCLVTISPATQSRHLQEDRREDELT